MIEESYFLKNIIDGLPKTLSMTRSLAGPGAGRSFSMKKMPRLVPPRMIVTGIGICIISPPT